MHPLNHSRIMKQAQTQVQIGKVKYDSVEGLGAHSDNRHVEELGFVALMKPTSFLYVVNKIRKQRVKNDQTHMDYVQKHLRDGESIGAPRIYLEIDGDDIKVISHEGRHRATNINKIQPNKDLMVHVIIRKSNIGKGRKGITRQHFEEINWRIVPQEKYDKEAARPVFMFRHAFWKNEDGKVEKVI